MTSRENLGHTRRQAFALAAGTAATGVSLTAAPATAAPAPPSLPRGACVVTPEATEGPYYFDPKLERAAIAAGKSGAPVKLRLQVVGPDCRPLARARVDVWQADSQGVYSGFAAQGDSASVDTRGETFLRGAQFTGADGEVVFTTIFPGWYQGRAPHIHAKVWLDQTTVLNSQLYFPDALSQYIYDNAPAYRREATRDTLNFNDLFRRPTGDAGFVDVREQSDHYAVSLVLAVDPNARAKGFFDGLPGGRGAGPPPGFPGGARPGGPPPPAGGMRLPPTRALPPDERLRRLIPSA